MSETYGSIHKLSYILKVSQNRTFESIIDQGSPTNIWHIEPTMYYSLYTIMGENKAIIKALTI